MQLLLKRSKQSTTATDRGIRLLTPTNIFDTRFFSKISVQAGGQVGTHLNVCVLVGLDFLSSGAGLGMLVVVTTVGVAGRGFHRLGHRDLDVVDEQHLPSVPIQSRDGGYQATAVVNERANFRCRRSKGSSNTNGSTKPVSADHQAGTKCRLQRASCSRGKRSSGYTVRLPLPLKERSTFVFA